MPARWFICPDGERTEIKDCLNGKGCRLRDELPAGRCLSAPTLRAIAEQRTWNGVPSTTQLLKGTREAFLEITTDYALDPQANIFRINGTKAHAFLERFTDGEELAEERLIDEICSGIPDLYSEGNLYDHKFWGSYKIMRALGLYQQDVPVLDDSGEPVYYKTGARRGQLKTRKEWFEGGPRLILDVAIQLNDYRRKLEAILPDGYKIERMFVEALARDGGTYIARRRGVTQNGVLIPINRISDKWIVRYLTAKRDALLEALETGETPPRCRWREQWGGRKCDGYCNVAEECYRRDGVNYDGIPQSRTA